ncbi:MAG: nucleotidyltransferase domain-containing protein [Nitrospira sp.]|nr:nucleotidyltransferase domain-containing protein [Nitrospira sp.]
MVKDSSTQYQQAREAAEACIRVLKEQFGAREVYVFGSLAGQSPWHSRSDIDLAVEGLPPKEYMRALSTLWELLPEGLELDLITLEDAPPELVARIKGEVKMPEDPKEALKQDMVDELINLGRLVDEAKLLLQRVPQEPTFIEIRAAGSVVHDFYNGVERIFERIAVRLGPGLPAGENWHTLLLQSMGSGIEGIRAAVIDQPLALRLLDYLRFRHRFRHTYGYELQWDRLRSLVEGLEETLTRLRQQIDRFIKTLEQP